jgi:hypothetical protein
MASYEIAGKDKSVYAGEQTMFEPSSEDKVDSGVRHGTDQDDLDMREFPSLDLWHTLL